MSDVRFRPIPAISSNGLRGIGGEPRARPNAVSGMHRDTLYDEATKVTAEDGEVILDGPDGVDLKITPEAADQTADNLIKGAAKAAGQRRLSKLPHRAK